MRFSQLFARTLREAPSDAEAASHRLLVRAGFIRRSSSGVYSFLPLGWRVLRRIEAILRKEIEHAGGQEVLLPILHPIDLFERSGRREIYAGDLFELDGRGGRFALGPTHEEVVTALVSNEVESHRDLPLILFQIQTKFRDEARPRYGLLRTREFVMKDAYSFDATKEGMASSYQVVLDAYHRIFERCGLDVIAVEAESGAIGGDVNHEFMVESAIGEDHFARCQKCGYAANVEAAEAGPRIGPDTHVAPEPLVEHHTPDRPGIDLVVEFFSDRQPPLTAAGMLKCLALKDGDGKPVVVLVPGDREVRIPKGLQPFDDDDFAARPELVKGYIGPMGLTDKGIRVLADHAVRTGGPWVTGANRPDHHVSGATYRRDFVVDEWGSFATVASGDPCPRCGMPLELVRSVEAGHCFQLGHRYTDDFWMGCYGIGVSRLLAVVAEAHHDGAGLAWPAPVAPFDIHLISLRQDEMAARIHDELTAAGLEVLFDDRDLSPGVKFADADLIGVPVQLIVGAKGLARGVVERKVRSTGLRDEVSVDQLRQAMTP